MQKRIVIIGAGPTGLGAAYRLHELGYANWTLYERNDYPGGHGTSFLDEQGFTWDEGGHVIFSHYPYFDRMVGEALGGEVRERIRESWVLCQGSFVPYPFQNNLRYLPKAAQVECLLGAARAWAGSEGRRAGNFRDWIINTFGEGIATHFMFPYNEKVWTTPLEEMSKDWIAERVPVIDFSRLLHNVVHGRDDVAWGPNSKFKFPLRGGTGEIYRRIARRLESKINLGKELAGVDRLKKTVAFTDGSGDRYDALVSTMPLDLLCKALAPVNPELLDSASRLRHNNLLVLGFGLRKKIQTTRCWMYFPDPGIPCYRATYFSNYSPYNVPDGDVDHYSSIMCEMSYNPGQSLNVSEITERTFHGLVAAGVLEEGDRERVVSRYSRQVPYSYPIPALSRDDALRSIQPWLMQNDIWSRGRFGAWRYEAGNMDHSVMMGVEAVNNILEGEEETTFSGKH